ncbi:MAG: hypothetical protein EBS84_06745 [Proteobacteria bacterium]|nr:hypothetical protein [Verrucomicrobiota bacterium]NBU08696.1 hypothetical protein [Pseudomonadota bacterium]
MKGLFSFRWVGRIAEFGPVKALRLPCPEVWLLAGLLGLLGAKQTAGAGPIATPEAALAAKADLWGEAALREPNGPSYEFFAPLLPPLRYVNADFRHYPIVLSAPGAPVKARFIANGSGVNLPGGARSWNDVGTPVTFRVGIDELRFGEFPERLRGPRYEHDWLPVVRLDYQHEGKIYRQETFACVEPELAQHGVVLVRFTLPDDEKGTVVAQIESKVALRSEPGRLVNEAGEIVAWFDSPWKWQPGRQRLVAPLATPKSAATLAIATQPAPATLPSPVEWTASQRHRAAGESTWQELVGRGMQLSVPEPVVMNAWRSLLVGTHALIRSNRMHYSAGNQYDRLYQAEGCDALHALLWWGHEVRPLAVSQLDFTRKGLEFHQAGHKLQLLTHLRDFTHDDAFIRELRPKWEKEIALIVNSRTNAEGLFPREQYCGDIATPVFSLNSNAKAWRALRDFSATLDAMGEPDEARRLAAVAGEFKQRILAAVEKSSRPAAPGFVPIALSGEEEPYDVITATKLGSYWNLMANYVLGAGILHEPRERALLDYLQQHGGLVMGLTRSRPNVSFWTGPHSANPLYGTRYVLTLLRRDEPERALVSFYGMLAQGFTWDTFIAGEGGSLTPLDARGRLFYCPPNSAGNAHFLTMLRHLLVQDWDLDDDGRPETLRLAFATPRRWLEDGKEIKVERAPTAFGTIAFSLRSRLNAGEVIADFTPPARTPKQTLLRVRVPEGWQVASARAGERELKVDAQGTVDLTTVRTKATLRFEVKRASQ